jgi:superoxide dismutase, Fe-Mn family
MEVRDMKFDFPQLPYPTDAFEPVYSARTVELHYGKHHRGYFEKTVDAVRGTPLEEKDLEELVCTLAKAKDANSKKLFNNAAQVWNHNEFWESMSPHGGGAPRGQIAELIDSQFGGLAQFKEKFQAAAEDRFGSGWVWLIPKSGGIALVSTGNADNPLTRGIRPLIAFDVWEHAYYLDYQNRRAEFADAFIDRLVNWDHANAMLAERTAMDLVQTTARRRNAK